MVVEREVVAVVRVEVAVGVRDGVTVVVVELRVADVVVLRVVVVAVLRVDEVVVLRVAVALRLAVAPDVDALREAVEPDAVAAREVVVTARRWYELSNVADTGALRVPAARFCSTAAVRVLRAVSARRASIWRALVIPVLRDEKLRSGVFIARSRRLTPREDAVLRIEAPPALAVRG